MRQFNKLKITSILKSSLRLNVFVSTSPEAFDLHQIIIVSVLLIQNFLDNILAI